jgi:hypothetical protein
MNRMLAAACAGLASLPLVAMASTSPAVAAAPEGAPRVTLMGDSTLMAMEYYANDDELIATTYDVNLETGNCRRLVVPSCPVGGQATPSALPVMQTTQKGRLGQVLVMMAGYDDTPSIADDIDAIMAEATAQGVGEVLWLSYRESPTYFLPSNGPQGAPIYADHNQRLAEATSRWANLSILDWHGYSIGHPEWFSSDGIHLRPSGSVELARFIKAALDARPLTRCDVRNALTGAPDVPGPVPATVAPAAGLVPAEPVRVLDTRRPDLGGANGMIGAGRTVTVPLDAVVPAGTTAAVLSVGAVDPCATGYLTVFPCGELPFTSNVNYAARRNTATMVVSMLHDGDVCLHSSAATDLIVDVLGAFVPGGAPFHPIEPTRWLDTRGGGLEPVAAGPVAAGAALNVPVAGRGGVAAGASAVMVNVTVAGSTGETAISLRPGPCAGTPTTSVVNVSPGRDGAASAIVGLGPDGSVCATTFSGGGHLVLDVAGWFGAGPGGMTFAAATPTRLLDTRLGGAAPVPARGLATQPLGAVSMLSVAMLDTAAPGWAAVTPCGATATSSLLNTVAGEPMANATAVAPGAGGALCLTPSTAAHFVVDRVGTFSTA